MIEANSRGRKIAYWVFLVTLSFMCAFVFFEILTGVIQSHEESGGIIIAYLSATTKVDNMPGIAPLLLKWIVSFMGISYDTQRLLWAFFYYIICFLTIDVSLRDNRWRINYWLTPAIIVFLVFLHLSGEYISGHFGDVFNDTRVYTGYPMAYHIQSTLCALFVMAYLYRFHRWREEGKLLRYYGIAVAWVIIVNMSFGGFTLVFDYLLMTIIPIFLMIIRDVFVSRGKENIFYAILLGIALTGVLCVLVVANIPFFKSGILYYSLQRIMPFTNIKNIGIQLQYYIDNVLANYNADYYISDLPIRMHIVYAIRVCFVGFIFFCLFRCMANFFRTRNGMKVDALESCLCIGIVGMSVLFIGTSAGFVDRARYLSFMLPYGTIIFAKNVSNLWEERKWKKVVIIEILCACIILLSYNKDWNKRVNDENIQNIIELVERYDLHDGMAAMHISNRITIQSEGKAWVNRVLYDAEKNEFSLVENFYKPDSFIDYIIFRENWAYGGDIFTLQDIYDVYGKPDYWIIEGYYAVLIYNDGVGNSRNEEIGQEIRNANWLDYDLSQANGVTVNEENDAIISAGGSMENDVKLENGIYRVTIYGENLSSNVFSVIDGSTNDELQYTVFENGPENVIVEFEIADPKNIEFVISNTNSKDIVIKRYFYEQH